MNRLLFTALLFCRTGILSVAVTAPVFGQVLTTLISLPLAAQQAPLVQGTDGNFYAAGLQGIFKLTPTGIATQLYTSGVPGGLIQASDGSFYGLASVGQYGRFFKITSSGAVTSLYSFIGGSDGANPSYGVIQATDGNFYGVSTGGGLNTKGAIFRITPQGTLTTLYSFGTTASDGSGPVGRLVQGSDGELYGVCRLGGNSGYGTVFKVSTLGVFTLLHTFTAGTDGGHPQSGLIQDGKGNLWGTTGTGSAATVFSGGTIYQITTGGSLTTLYAFGSAKNDTGFGSAPLTLASDGNFYGNTYGIEGGGVLFRMTPAGAYTVLDTFPTDGGSQAGMIQASDGTLYGISNNTGVVFKLYLTPSPPPVPTILTNGVVPVYSTVSTIQQGEWISIYGKNLATATTTWNGDFPLSLGNTNVTVNGKPAYLWFVSPTQINLQTPSDASTGSIQVDVTTPGGSATATVTLAQVAPSFSLLDAKHVTGIILRSNGSGAFGGGSYDVIGPAGTSLGYPTVPAKAGDTVALFGVGFGPTKPAVPAGAVFSGAAATTNPVTLLINNSPLTPAFAGETSAGLYQFNLTIPAGLGTGDQPGKQSSAASRPHLAL